MALTQLAPPYPIFTDKNGDPLDNGYLYFGEVNKNPETNAIQVYYDSAFTQPAAQPLRTSNGYVMRNGSPALIYAGSQFSVTVRDKNNALVIYSPVGYGIDPASVSGIVTTADHTGDGSTLVFGMGASPIGVNATSVYIDGVYQEKDTYTVNGTNLTFSEAPPLNASIEIVVQESGIIGGTSADLVTYNQSGTGAVTRSVKAKLQEFVSVKDFGAVGDGVADDTIAINRATKFVANAGGGTVYYPAGTYRITRAIRLDEYDIETFTYTNAARVGVHHVGAGMGATIIKADGFWTSIFTNFPEPFVDPASVVPTYKAANAPGVVPEDEFVWLTEDLTIRDMTLDCDYNANVDGGAAYGPYYASWGGTWPDGSTGASTWAADNYQYPIYIRKSNNVRFENLEVINSWYNGIELYTIWNCVVTGCLIKNCGDKANYLGYYCAIEPDNACSGITITDNFIQDCGPFMVSNGDWRNYVWRAVEKVTISNNTIRNCRAGIFAFDWIDQWTVSNNVIEDCQNFAISFAYETPPGTVVGGFTAPDSRHPQNIKVTDNTIKNFNLANGSSQVCIRCAGSNFAVSDNLIYQLDASVTNKTYGIVLSDTFVVPVANAGFMNVVSNNTFSGNFPASDTTSGMLSIGAKNTIASDNVFNASGSGNYIAVRISADDVVVSDNLIVGTYGYSSGQRPIFYGSGSRPFVRDARFGPFFDLKTASGAGSLSGTVTVPWSTLTPTTIDNRGNFNSGTESFVADIPGRYKLETQVQIGSATAGVVFALYFERNGTVAFGASSETTVGGQSTIVTSTILDLNAGDAMRVRAYVASGSYSIDADSYFRAEMISQRS